MRFCAAVGVPEKSVFTRLFKVFATAVLANFQDRLVMTASISLRILPVDFTKYPPLLSSKNRRFALPSPPVFFY